MSYGFLVDPVLRSILLCPAFSELRVLAGTYIEGGSKADGNTRRMIQRNAHERYHVLTADEKFGNEALVLDFKLVLGTGPEFLHSLVERRPETVVAVLCSPYRDRLMQRFLNYFGRIAEPEDQ